MKAHISSAIIAEIQERAHGARNLEICGLLFGTAIEITGYQQADNVAEDPRLHFEIDPVILIAAEREMRQQGRAITGYFHSHPGGDVQPSKTDALCAASDGRIWLIVNGEHQSAWRAEKNGELYGRFTRIDLDCAPVTRHTGQVNTVT